MKMSWNPRQLGLAILTTIGMLCAGENSVDAQIAPDTTLGNENSTVTSTDAVDTIDGGWARGTNLFHSFQEFNVNEGRAAVFTNPVGIENIFTRVTGANPSNILGTLGTAGGNANLFLINPNGIIFGQNAKLDVKGSFVATTANAIKFGEQGFFSATDLKTPPLLTIQPSALFFNQTKIGSIENRSIAPAGSNLSGQSVAGLRVPNGQSLLLVGGDIAINGGRLYALGGRVQLGGIASSGTVELNANGSKPNLNFPDELVKANVSLTNGAVVNVAADGGGTIEINAKNVDISGSSFLLAGIARGVGTPETQAGDVTLNATEAVTISQSSIIQNLVNRNATGNGGNINIRARTLDLTSDSDLIAVTLGRGSAGDVIIDTSDAVKIDSFSGIISSVYVAGSGDSGDINITAGSLSLSNGAEINSGTYGQGKAGNININARKAVAIAGLGRSNLEQPIPVSITSITSSEAKGNAGDVNISGESISLTNFTAIEASSFGSGDAGNVTLEAKDAIAVVESGINARVGNLNVSTSNNAGSIKLKANSIHTERDSFIDSSNFRAGNSGDMLLQANSILLQDPFIRSQIAGIGTAGSLNIVAQDSLRAEGGRTAQPTVTIETFGPSRGGNINIQARSVVLDRGVVLNAKTSGEGRGGDINITTKSLSAFGGGQINASTTGSGDAGSVTITATDLAEFEGSYTPISDPRRTGAFTSVEKSSTGNAGNVTIETGRLIVRNGARLSAETTSGEGGNLKLKAQKLLLLRNNGQISTTAGTQGGGGNGGNIDIDTPLLVATPHENNDITANAFTGRGGKIQIAATGIFGLTPRRLEELQRLSGTNTFLNPAGLPSSDITAISQTNPTLSGQVNINTSDVNPSGDLAPLPIQLVDVSKLIAQGCSATVGQEASKFIIIGRGGLPDRPSQSLGSDAIDVDLVTLNSQIEQPTTAVSTSPIALTPTPIVEAQSWAIAANGEVILTADAQAVTPHNSWQKTANCQQLNKSQGLK